MHWYCTKNTEVLTTKARNECILNNCILRTEWAAGLASALQPIPVSQGRKRETPQEFLPLTTNLSILQQIRKVSQFSSTSTEVFRNTFLIYALIFLKGIGKGKGVPVGSRLTRPENKPAAASLSFSVCKVKCL